MTNLVLFSQSAAAHISATSPFFPVLLMTRCVSATSGTLINIFDKVANFMFYVSIDICQLSITIQKVFFITQANMIEALLGGLHTKICTESSKPH